MEPAEEPVTNTIPQNLSDNEYAIYTALRDVGLSKAGTAAVMGCMSMESGLKASAENPSDGGYGLLQWTYSRKTDLFNWCYGNGYDPNTVTGQVMFFVYELNSTYSKAAKYSYPVYETHYKRQPEDCLSMFFLPYGSRNQRDNLFPQSLCRRADHVRPVPQTLNCRLQILHLN